jgi:diguanylate cyclase (GGDEF)-like protein/PAS domain S-box-containing protein
VHWLPFAVFAVGLLSTAVIGESQRRFSAGEHLRLERDLAHDIAGSIGNKLNTDRALLSAVTGLFNASEQVTLAEFQSFFRSLDLSLEALQGIQGVGYAAVVPGNAITAFEQRIRREGQPEFRIFPPGPRPLTTAIVYLEPLDWRNARAIGFDMYSESTRRQAMHWAASTGQPSLSGPVRLVQEGQSHQQIGALIYEPIYLEPNKPFTSERDRLRRLRGWAYSPLRMGDLINAVLTGLNNPDLAGTGVLIYDGDSPIRELLLYDNLGLHSTSKLDHPTWVSVPIANREWLIGIQLSRNNLRPDGLSLNLALIGLFGVLSSLLAAVITRMLVNNHLALRQALQLEQQVARERALASTVFETSPLGIVVTDPDGIVVSTNQAFSQLSGYSQVEARGHKANLLKSGRHDEAFYRQMWQSIIQKGHWNGEIWNRHRNGQVRRHDLNITAVLDNQQQIVNFVGLLRDVTDRYTQEEQMRHLATHDYLTGLPNRALLMEQLQRALALARRQGGRVGLLFLDLNGFKPVNDRFGHASGDLLLQAVAQRLQQNVRECDTLCRQGGDEFVLLIPDAPDLEQLRHLAEKLQQAVAGPYPELAEEMRISASIGIARWPDHAQDADSLLDAADMAMYAAKEAPADHIALATPQG